MGSIRPRILKDSKAWVPATSRDSVAVGSIRPRILKAIGERALRGARLVVAVGSIRPRILKGSRGSPPDGGSGRCSGLDPTEDTERAGRPGAGRSPEGVAVGSIRPRILKELGGLPGKDEDHLVAVGSIRPRILKGASTTIRASRAFRLQWARSDRGY